MPHSTEFPALRRSALQIAFIYAAASIAWISASDILLEHLAENVDQLTFLNVVKGFLFIGITAVILYSLINRLLGRISQQQAALVASEQRMMLALEATGDGVWDWDLAAGSCFYSSGWKQIIGFVGRDIDRSPDEWLSRIHPDDAALHREILRRHLEGETGAYQGEYRLRCSDDSYKWIQNRGKVVERDDRGQPLRMVGTLRDISAQKKAEKEHRQQSALLQALFRATPVAIYLLDVDGRVTLWNPAAERIFGWSAEETVGNPLPIVQPEKRDEHACILARIKGGHAFQEIELTRVRKDGRSIEISLSTAPLLDGDGRISGIASIASDVTARKQTENEIRRLTQFYSLILDTIHTGVCVFGPDDVITYVNHGLETIEGVPADRIIGTSIVKDMPETSYGGILAIYRQTREEREPAFYEAVPVTSSSGRTTYRSGWLVPLFSGDRFDGMICTVEDITERRNAEKESSRYQEQLRVMNSMRALDEELQRHSLATALHDGVGQLLAMARIKLSVLQGSLAKQNVIAPFADLQETLDEAISATRSLTMEISPPILYQLGLEAALEGLVDTFRTRHGLPATFREEGVARSLNEETRIFLYQSTRELLMNVLKHAKAGTVAVVCTRQSERIVITVADDGVGFAPPRPGGTPGSYGLFSIAERMHHIGGTLDISSSPGQGTKIELIAPVSGP